VGSHCAAYTELNREIFRDHYTVAVLMNSLVGSFYGHYML